MLQTPTVRSSTSYYSRRDRPIDGVRPQHGCGCGKSNPRAGLRTGFPSVNVTNGETYKIATMLRQHEVAISFVSSTPKQEVPEELQSSPFMSKPFQPADIRGAVSA